MPAIRSSHSYHRYSPYSSARSNKNTVPGDHPSTSKTSPRASSIPRCASVLPTQHTSTHQLENLANHGGCSESQQIVPLKQPYFQTPCGPQHPHLTANVMNADLTILHPSHGLPNPEPLLDERLSVVSRPRDDTGDHHHLVHQGPLHLTLGQMPTQQGPIYYGHGMFSKSQNFSVTNSTFIDNSTTADNFMEKLLLQTIIGAEYDSSARYPPPRCHPGTRLAIVERCKAFIVECHDNEKMRWVVGPAGVGKSAIMQMVAEETPADASVFFSVNGRQDGTKTFTTIAYQLAAKCEPYRQFIRNEVNRDPSLLHKSLPVQFQNFLVEPVIHRHLFHPSRRVLIIIDGLDECDNPVTQGELLGLIASFCLSYPTSPVVWFVASRPEPHITSFFDDEGVALAYTKEEIMIDTDEACEDVQRYLRDELSRIKLAYPTLKRKREWPSELEFTKIATAAGGLFAYASTVIRYIDDPYYQDPAVRLRHVLETIDSRPKNDVSGRDHPMAQLDALYARILSNIPSDVMVNTRKLLYALSTYGGNEAEFRSQCNRLGFTEDVAYGAVRHLHAVVKVPTSDEADDERLEYFHKSFADFLSDFKRSKFSQDLEDEVREFQTQTSIRILGQLSKTFDGTDKGKGIKCYDHGYVKYGRRFCDSISLSWPCDERLEITDAEQRRGLYLNSLTIMCSDFNRRPKSRWSMSCFHALTTSFTAPAVSFPIYQLRDCAFDKFRLELMDLGKLKKVPLRTLDYAAICGRIDFRFTSPTATDVDPWSLSCEHTKEDDKQSGGWSTSFARSLNGIEDGGPRFSLMAAKEPHRKIALSGVHECLYCSRRLARYFIDKPDQLATVFVDSTEMCYVELSFVDPDNSTGKWRYWFCHSGIPIAVD